MFLWSIFKIGSVTAHCGQCKHWRISHDSEPCASCIQGQMSKSKDIVLVVSGKCFEPRDPERFEKVKALVVKYGSRYQELTQAQKAFNKELSKSAKELGISISDFKNACKPGFKFYDKG